jgi:excisionase family DNA binding protein
MHNPDLLTREAAAEYLNLQVCTLEGWAHMLKNLPYLKLGRRVMYSKADLDEYLKSCKVLPLRYSREESRR